MRTAFRDLVEYCPPALTNLRANVVLLTGNVEDDFALGIDRGRTNLTGFLLNLYQTAAEHILLYSLSKGLRRIKVPSSQSSCERPQDQPDESSFSPGASIDRVLARKRAEYSGSLKVNEIGTYVNAPSEAIREINRVLTQSQNGLVLFNYSAMIQFIGDGSADLVPIIEGWPNVCRDNQHLIIFYGIQQHSELERLFPQTVQKVRRFCVGGPDQREIETVVFQEEVAQRRSIIDCNALTQVVSAMGHVAEKRSSGLKTLIDNYLRDPSSWLDAQWAKENGASNFDLKQIDLAKLKYEMDAAIIGQENAKQEVFERLRRLVQFPKRDRGPFLRMLFVGPSGVGKTEIARILCRQVFESEAAMLTVACTEYSQPHEVAKLLGAPPGYTGHEQPALLESHRNRFPAGLLLLDEFEKAHPDVHRFFMNILEEGTATSPRSEGGQPVTIDFKNYIIIATSNAGSQMVDSVHATHSPEDRERLYGEALKRVFPAELLGRFQERLVFEFLSDEQLESIARHYAEIQLKEFVSACEIDSKDNPTLEIDPALYAYLVNSSDRALGARNLRGQVEKVFQHVWLDQYVEVTAKPSVVRFTVEDAKRVKRQ